MNFPSMIGGGIVGGALGATIWAAIIYFTNYEVGYVAILVGILVGYCVKLGAGTWQGFVPGAIAAVLAIVSVTGGKYAAATLQANEVVQKMNTQVTDYDLKLGMADQLVSGKTEKKLPITWRNGKTSETAESLEDYPADIVESVNKSWETLSAEQKAAQLAERQKMIDEFQGEMATLIRHQAFMASFSPYDLLFFGLATYAAFQLGSNAAPKPEIPTKSESTDQTA